MQIKASDVPAALRYLIPLAARWGIGDDVDRYNAVEDATPAERLELRSAIPPEVDRHFDEWLAGDEVNGPTWTAAYLAFSNLRMAVDEAEAIDGFAF